MTSPPAGKSLAGTYTIAGCTAPPVESQREQAAVKVDGFRFRAEFAPYECRRFRVTP